MLLTRKAASQAVAQPRLSRGLSGAVAKTMDRRTFLKRSGVGVGGAAVALVLFIQIYLVVGQLSAAKQPFPPLGTAKMDDVHNIGFLLFSNYNLPFQIIGVPC